FHLKQRGALLAKGRLLGIQFQHLFGDNALFFSLATHANTMAAKLAAGITARGYALAAETETNLVFPILPHAVVSALQRTFAFYVWAQADDEHSVIRRVTSWATEEGHVDAFLA